MQGIPDGGNNTPRFDLVFKSVSGLCSFAHACIGEFHSLDSDGAAIC